MPSSERQVAGIYGQPFADLVKSGMAGVWVEFDPRETRADVATPAA